MKRLLIFLISLFLVFVLNSCTGESDDIPSLSDYPTMDRLIEGGYEDLLNGDYEEANEKFREANSRDAFDVRAYDGLGWSYLFVSNPSLAINAFSGLITFGETAQDTLNAAAGKAFAYEASQEFALAKTQALYCLGMDEDYQHQVLNSIDYHDLHVTLARCYYDENKLDDMLMELQSNNSGALSSVLMDETSSFVVEQDSMINPASGAVRIPLNGANIAFLENASLEGMSAYVIKDHIDFTSNEVVLISNPIPQVGFSYQLEFKKVDQYIDLKTALNAELEDQLEMYRE